MSENIMKGYNLDNFEANFREFLITQKVAPVTLKNYLSDLRHFLGWFVFHISSQKKDLTLEQNNAPFSLVTRLDDDSVKAYKSYLENNKLPVKTINRRLSTLRKFCSLCISQGWLSKNPAKNVSNVASHKVHHEGPVVQIEVESEHIDNEYNENVFSAKRVSEFQKSLAGLSVGDVQTIVKDVEEFFVIINSTKIV